MGLQSVFRTGLPLIALSIALLAPTLIAPASENHLGALAFVPHLALGLALLVSVVTGQRGAIPFLLTIWLAAIPLCHPGLPLLPELGGSLLWGTIVLFAVPNAIGLARLNRHERPWPRPAALVVPATQIALIYFMVATLPDLTRGLIGVALLPADWTQQIPIPDLPALLACVGLIWGFGRLLRPDPAWLPAAEAVAVIAVILAALIQSATAAQAVITAAGGVWIWSVLRDAGRAAHFDPLTGLAGRQACHEALARVSRRYAVVAIDIDGFRYFNEAFGQTTGDKVLRALGQWLRQSASGQSAYRVGGEEFFIICRGHSAEDGARIAEGLRRRFGELARGLAVNDAAPLTFSAGVADWRHGTTSRKVAMVADAALSKAKQSGQDQVIVAWHGTEQAEKSSASEPTAATG